VTTRQHAEATPGLGSAPGWPFRGRSRQPWYVLNEKTRFTLLLLAPSAILLALFQILPIIIGANASFRDWRLYDPQRTWVGLQHYVYILTDPIFLKVVLPNTLLLMVFSVSIGLCLGLALAHLMNRHFFGHAVIQTIILLPLMVAPVIASIMMRWMFNDQFGIVAAVIEALGFGSIAWLSERWPSFAIIVLTDVWLWTPWFTIILLAGLRSLPKEPYRGGRYRRCRQVAGVHPYHAADDALGDGGVHRDPVDRRVSHLRPGLGHHRRRPGPADRGVQHLRLYGSLRVHELRARHRGGDHRRHHHRHVRLGPLQAAQSLHGGVAMTAATGAYPRRAAPAFSMRWRRAAGACSSCCASPRCCCCSPFRSSGWC
jgi:hypothetical protein